MKGLHTEFRNCKSIRGVAIAGLAFGSTPCKLNGTAALGCQLLGNIGWAALEALRPVLLLAAWQGVPAYLYEDAGFLGHLLQIGATLWPLVRVLTGQA
jgi:hypothetical protein